MITKQAKIHLADAGKTNPAIADEIKIKIPFPFVFIFISLVPIQNIIYSVLLEKIIRHHRASMLVIREIML